MGWTHYSSQPAFSLWDIALIFREKADILLLVVRGEEYMTVTIKDVARETNHRGASDRVRTSSDRHYQRAGA